MTKCGKGCMPECEYFTTGGCISPFNCMYKEESGYINSATSGTVIYTGGMNMTNEEMIENLKCVIADIFEQCEQLKAENAALRERLERTVELPYSHLEMLKLLTCASICYAEIKNLIVTRMAKSRDVADLFMECPTVQGTTLDLALYRLAESNIDCNKIKGFEEVINATGSFKDYLAKAEARLAELKGGKE